MQIPNIPYIISNENLRAIVAATPGARRILTIAGSGDQALFYTLGGATHVDTFDRLSNARTIQDIKTAAISQLSHSQYIEMMKNMRNGAKKHVPEIVKSKMPAYSVAMLDNLMFCNSLTKENISRLPTAREYARLQATIRGSFNFIHENLTDIHTRVTGPYDVINISNIFDGNYIGDTSKQMQILHNLTPLLRVGGAIVYNNQMGRQYDDIPMTLPNTNMAIRHKRITAPQLRLDIFQRIR